MYTYAPAPSGAAYKDSLASVAGKVTQPGSGLEITFMETVAIGAGQNANNPWLQEMPDPVTRCAWGNYLALPVYFDGTRKFIAHENLEDGDLAEVKLGDKTFKVPVVKQFGQTPNPLPLLLGMDDQLLVVQEQMLV